MADLLPVTFSLPSGYCVNLKSIVIIFSDRYQHHSNKSKQSNGGYHANKCINSREGSSGASVRNTQTNCHSSNKTDSSCQSEWPSMWTEYG